MKKSSFIELVYNDFKDFEISMEQMKGIFSNKSSFDEIVQIILKIYILCPKKNCHFITVGSSPISLNFFLDKLEIPNSNFPISGLSSDNYKPLQSTKFTKYRDFINDPNTSTILKNIKEKHANFLNKISKEEKAEFVVIDYAYYGDSLLNASRVLYLILNEENIKNNTLDTSHITIKGVALTGKPNRDEFNYSIKQVTETKNLFSNKDIKFYTIDLASNIYINEKFFVTNTPKKLNLTQFLGKQPIDSPNKPFPNTLPHLAEYKNIIYQHFKDAEMHQASEKTEALINAIKLISSCVGK